MLFPLPLSPSSPPSHYVLLYLRGISSPAVHTQYRKFGFVALSEVCLPWRARDPPCSTCTVVFF